MCLLRVLTYTLPDLAFHAFAPDLLPAMNESASLSAAAFTGPNQLFALL